MPQRYSRHYYDLYRMAQTPVKDVAFSHINFLKTVVDFKMKFYPRAWAKYPEAEIPLPKTDFIPGFHLHHFLRLYSQAVLMSFC